MVVDVDVDVADDDANNVVVDDDIDDCNSSCE